MPYKRPESRSGYDWETSAAYSDSTTHYSDLTPKSSETSTKDIPVSPVSVRGDWTDATITATEPCLITNTTQNVRRSRFVARDTSHINLSKLEHGMGLPWGSINVNSHLNFGCLSAELHDAFNQGFLILLPETRITDLIIANPRTPIVELLKDQTYTYTLMSAGTVRTIRRHFMVEGKDVVKEYQHPYLDFPSIRSHIHPVFMIWSIIQRLNFSRLGMYYESYPLEPCGSYRHLLARTFNCASLWKKKIPPSPGFYKARSAVPIGQYDLDSLVSYRADSKTFEHALAHALEDENCLDGENMRKFLGEEHRRLARKRRERFIRKWVHMFSRTKFEPMPEHVVDDEETEQPIVENVKSRNRLPVEPYVYVPN